MLDTVHHLVGMQAQVPLNPYLGLWSRLAGFDPAALAGLMEDRAVVRAVVMRGTIHLVTADDCLGLRPLTQPVLDREISHHRDYAPLLAGVDLGPPLAFARHVLAEPRTVPQLRAALAERFPDLDAAALAYACRCLLPLVQVPPRGVWGRTAQVTYATAQAWLGRPLDPAPSIDEVVLRYLRAFGPASVADVATWCRLTGMRAVVERLRPGLRTFADESGRELFDVPDGPLADPATPAPPRFLPEYDNVLLSHDDRSRFAHPDAPEGIPFTAPVRGTVLCDGWVAASWSVEGTGKGGGPVTLVVRPIVRLSKQDAGAVAAEGGRLLGLLHPGAGHDVRLDAFPG